MNYVASCSFGKDSLAAIVAAERAGVHIDEAVYCRIMFDRETSAELPEHEEFIHCTAIPLLKSRYGIKTTIVQEKRTYCECFYTVKSRKCSKNKGQIWGFPSLWAPWCNGSLKIPPIEHWRKTAGEYVSIVGIAADEKKRVKKKTVDGKYLPLVEQEITEAAAFDICKREGLLSPAYKKGRTRLGCWFCHNQRINEFVRSSFKITQKFIHVYQLLAADSDMGNGPRVNQPPDTAQRHSAAGVLLLDDGKGPLSGSHSRGHGVNLLPAAPPGP